MTNKCDSEFRITDDFDEVFNRNFKHWKIDDKGNISLNNQPHYEITYDRLIEQNWLNQVISKCQEDATHEFYFVFIEALRRAKYKTITIDLKDPVNKITAEREC